MRSVEREIKSAIERLPSSWTEKIKEFDRYLKVERGIKEGTRLNYMRALTSLCKSVDKPLEDITKEDMVGWKEKAMSALKNPTISLYILDLKLFFQWFHRCEEREYPPVVRWMKSKQERKIANFEVTLEDVKKLADACKNQRDRCLIMLAYDTGCRPEELLNIKIKDLRKDDRGYQIWLQGGKGLKTGERVVRIYPSIPDVELWLSMHPNKNNPDASLFFSERGERLSYMGYYQLLREIKKKAGINKRIAPHSFRHLRATELCNTLSDAQMKARFGWTMDSKMLATYEHQAGVDVDECFLRHHGIDVEAEKPKTMEPRICPRGHKNSPSALYCSTCGLPLEEKELIGYQEEIEERGKGEDVFEKCGISKESVFDRLDQVLTKFILSDPVIIDRLYDRIKRSEEYQGLIENLTRKAVMDLLMEDKTKTVHLKSTPELNQKLNELFKKKHVVTREDLEKMGLVDD